MLTKFSKNKFDYINNAEFNGYSDGFDIEVLLLAHLKQHIKMQELNQKKNM